MLLTFYRESVTKDRGLLVSPSFSYVEESAERNSEKNIKSRLFSDKGNTQVFVLRTRLLESLRRHLFFTGSLTVMEG